MYVNPCRSSDMFYLLCKVKKACPGVYNTFGDHMTMKKISVLLFWGLIVFWTNVSSAVTSPLDQWHWSNPLPQGNTLNGITFGNNIFITVGDSDAIVYSDGKNWRTRTSVADNWLRALTFTDNILLAAGDLETILWSHLTVLPEQYILSIEANEDNNTNTSGLIP